MSCNDCIQRNNCSLNLFGRNILFCNKYQKEDIDYCFGCNTIIDCIIFKNGVDVESCTWRTFSPAETSRYHNNRISHAQIKWLKFLLKDCKYVDDFLRMIK